MKPFDTLTNQEMINLTDEQINQYVEYSLAEQGIAVILESLPKPEPLTVEPDSELIQLKDFDILIDKETSDQIMLLLSNTTIYKKDYKGNIKPLDKQDPYDYPKILVYRFESDKLKAEKAAKNRLLKLEWDEYNKRENEIQDALGYREEKLEKIFDKIQSVRNEEYNKKTKMDTWNKYLKLANNDKAIAKNFFIQYYSETDYNELFSGE